MDYFIEGYNDQDMMRREKILKNVVLKILGKIRHERRKPRLNEIIAYVKEKKHSGCSHRAMIIDKIYQLYCKDHIKPSEEGDLKFDKLSRYYGRLNANFTFHNETLDEIGETLNTYIKRRADREAMGPGVYKKKKREWERKTK